ncbi:hypothetical protein P4O66_021589 [Electrophorus voltai]|uniref:Uncharacterized protein n=1 Tax=Electrophorus voltai TaxID=2609070 RepID=A0AAD8ZQ65_9TELE|nr:hypothetical protein P4O66_021589 [Electrophorus voltai]
MRRKEWWCKWSLVSSPVPAAPATMSKLRTFWHRYKVLLVTGAGLGLVHWGWYSIKSSPLLQQKREACVPEPGLAAHVARASSRPDLPESERRSQSRAGPVPAEETPRVVSRPSQRAL